MEKTQPLSYPSGVGSGFPVGGAWTRFGGRGPPTQVLFSENVCENERIGSRRGERAPENFVCRSANTRHRGTTH